MFGQTRRKLHALEQQYRIDMKRNDPSYVLMLYSENPDVWKRMEAEIQQVPLSTIEQRYVGEKVRLLRHHARAIRALALTLQEMRG